MLQRSWWWNHGTHRNKRVLEHQGAGGSPWERIGRDCVYLYPEIGGSAWGVGLAINELGSMGAWMARSRGTSLKKRAFSYLGIDGSTSGRILEAKQCALGPRGRWHNVGPYREQARSTPPEP
ncbi:hypothetical protein [Candidatus Methylacidithermus pantelleriae]|nr:hypothetical protein [Candidatus Methylacidithermus pantelleriae]